MSGKSGGGNTNIPHGDGISSVHKASKISRVDAELTRIVLKNNILEFAGEHFLQVQGTAMGTIAPAYAKVFMGEVEKR